MIALLEVFYQPGKMFQSLPERKAAWVLPVILNCILLVLATWLVPHYMGRENVVRQQMEAFSSRMNPEQMQAAVTASSSPVRIYIGYAGTAVAGAVIQLAMAGLLLAFSMMTSRPPKFLTMLSMVSIAFFPYWLVTTAMTALIMISSPDPSSLDIRNLIATNAAAFINKDTMSKGLYSLMGSLDVLSFIEIGLLSLGFSKLTRVNFFFGLAAVLGLWVLYVSSKMAISLLF
jgi:hypothetical protein